MHDNSLVDQFINNENDATHVADQTFALELVLEDLVEALVNAVQNLPQDQLVVFCQPENVNRHITIASEDCGVAVYDHDVVFVQVR